MQDAAFAVWEEIDKIRNAKLSLCTCISSKKDASGIWKEIQVPHGLTKSKFIQLVMDPLLEIRNIVLSAVTEDEIIAHMVISLPMCTGILYVGHITDNPLLQNETNELLCQIRDTVRNQILMLPTVNVKHGAFAAVSPENMYGDNYIAAAATLGFFADVDGNWLPGIQFKSNEGISNSPKDKTFTLRNTKLDILLSYSSDTHMLTATNFDLDTFVEYSIIYLNANNVTTVWEDGVARIAKKHIDDIDKNDSHSEISSKIEGQTEQENPVQLQPSESPENTAAVKLDADIDEEDTTTFFPNPPTEQRHHVTGEDIRKLCMMNG